MADTTTETTMLLYCFTCKRNAVVQDTKGILAPSKTGLQHIAILVAVKCKFCISIGTPRVTEDVSRHIPYTLSELRSYIPRITEIYVVVPVQVFGDKGIIIDISQVNNDMPNIANVARFDIGYLLENFISIKNPMSLCPDGLKIVHPHFL